MDHGEPYKKFSLGYEKLWYYIILLLLLSVLSFAMNEIYAN